ncbi:MAG: MFS transporter, partial [Spirochaetales bacterium]
LLLYLKRRKRLVVITVFFHGISWILVLFYTWKTQNPWVGMVLFALGLFTAHLGSPAWASWMNDLVPPRQRGTFWANRNWIIGLAQFGAIFIAGSVMYVGRKIEWELAAFSILFLGAAAARLGGTYFLSRQYEPELQKPDKKSEFHFPIFLSRLFTSNFGRFTLFVMGIHFSVNIAACLIPAYVLKVLKVGYVEYSLLTITGPILALLFMPYWGPLADRYGNRRILLATGLFIPFLTLGWAFFSSLYLLLLLQIVGGFIWAGFNLCMSNFIYDSIRPVNLPKVFAYFNTLSTFSIFVGTLVGGALADLFIQLNLRLWGLGPIRLIFIISFFIRLGLYFQLKGGFQEVRPTEASPPIRYFYIDKPMTFLVARLRIQRRKIKKFTRLLIRKK